MVRYMSTCVVQPGTSECGYAEIRVNIFIRFLDIKYFIKLQ